MKNDSSTINTRIEPKNRPFLSIGCSERFQMKLYNRNFAVGERIEYMGWVNEGVVNSNISWQTYKPRFLVLKGTEVLFFDSPPVSIFPFMF